MEQMGPLISGVKLLHQGLPAGTINRWQESLVLAEQGDSLRAGMQENTWSASIDDSANET